MADVKNHVVLHFVWATYDRLPKLSREVRAEVEDAVRAAAEKMGCWVIAFGGVEDHVHVLVRFATTVSIADLAQEMKGYSSRVVTDRLPELYFKWQGGYGVFPVAPAQRARVEEYISNQEAHHRDRTLMPTLEDTGFIPRSAPARAPVPAVD